MARRPTSVTAISWTLIILSILAAGASLAKLGQPDRGLQEPLIVRLFGVVIMVAWAVCGYFLLKGKGIARYPFLLTAVGFNLYGLLTADVKLPLLLGMVIWMLFGYFLFRHQARTFFADNGVNLESPVLPHLRTVFAVVFYGVAVWLICGSVATAFFADIKPSARVLASGGLVLSALLMIVVGCAFSLERNMLRDFGACFLTAAGICFGLLIGVALNRLDPMSPQAATSAVSGNEFDVASGCVWILLIGLLGTTLLLSSKSGGSNIGAVEEES